MTFLSEDMTAFIMFNSYFIYLSAFTVLFSGHYSLCIHFTICCSFSRLVELKSIEKRAMVPEMADRENLDSVFEMIDWDLVEVVLYNIYFSTSREYIYCLHICFQLENESCLTFNR